MGKATIVSGGTDGLYSVSIDSGTAQRDAQVTKLTAEQATLVVNLTAAQTAYDIVVANEEDLKTAANDATDAYVAATVAVGPAKTAVDISSVALASVQGDDFATPEELAAAQAALTAANAAYQAAQAAVPEALKAYTAAASALAKAKQNTAGLRVMLDTLKSRQAQLTKELATLAALVLTQTLPAWCVDLTEDASGDVATIEIPGEDKLVLIAPAAPAHVPATDGVLAAREVQSPEQVFFNAAILPGWQKYKPTYRRGTITAVDAVADTADVLLDANDKSSAQALVINQTATLSAVPVQYMTCNTGAFEVGDRCVVKFTGQDWAQPKIVGFVDNPRSCGVLMTCIPATPTDQWGWTTPLEVDGIPVNDGKGTPATPSTRSFSGVHVPTLVDGQGAVTFVTEKQRRARQNTPSPGTEQDIFYNSNLSEYTQYTNPFYGGYDYASPSLASSLHAINREWVSNDLKLCVSTAFGDVRVSGIKKGSPIGDRNKLLWACVMDKATPTAADTGAKTKYICAWTYAAQTIGVYIRPLAGGEGVSWVQVASKAVTDYDPTITDGSLFAANPGIMELNPQACWLRKGARNASGNVCSMWAQHPRHFRIVSLSRAGLWAWILDYNIDTGALTSTAAPTETVSKGGSQSDGAWTSTFYSATGTRHIDFEYEGDAKTYTSLVFSGAYSASNGGSYNGNLGITLTKGAYSLEVLRENYAGSSGSYTTDNLHTILYHYGNAALCFSTLTRALSSTFTSGSLVHTRRLKFVLLNQPTTQVIDLLPLNTEVEAGSVVNMSDQPNYVYHGDPYTGPGGTDTNGLSALLENRLEYRRYRGLHALEIDRSLLNFRTLGNAYLLCVPKISYSGLLAGPLVVDASEYTTYCSDAGLFDALKLTAPSGAIKHIMLV